MSDSQKFKRSSRRYATEIEKRRVKKFVKETWHGGAELSQDEKFIGKLAANHGASCSCSACGNPRKYYNQLTKQELIQMELFPELLKEFEIDGTDQSTI